METMDLPDLQDEKEIIPWNEQEIDLAAFRQWWEANRIDEGAGGE